MENDPDYDAMTNAPMLDDPKDIGLHQTTVIEGGPSGGLFLQDDSEDEVDDAMRRAVADENLPNQQIDGDEMQIDQVEIEAAEEDENEDEDEQQEEEDDDDPIVKSYDIYATKILADHLYLFQYPIRPANRPYEMTDLPSEARIKPRIGQVQMDIPIHETAYYDTSRARQWTDTPLQKQTLGGTIASGRNYLIGRLEGDALHVTPVTGVAQIRPIFKYIDDHDREEKEAKKSDADKTAAARGPKALQLSVKSADAMPDLSTSALIRAAEEEAWIKLRWCDRLHQETTSVAAHMTTKKKDVLPDSKTTKAEYLDMLSTNGETEKEAAAATKLKKEGK